MFLHRLLLKFTDFFSGVIIVVSAEFLVPEYLVLQISEKIAL